MQNPLSLFLPEELLTHFELVEVKELGDISNKQMIFHIHLVEKNELPRRYNKPDYESKGFYQDNLRGVTDTAFFLFRLHKLFA